jgi:hypothetical protein
LKEEQALKEGKKEGQKNGCIFMQPFLVLSPACAALPASRTKRFKVVTVSSTSGSSD